MADSVILKNSANNSTVVNAVETVMDNFHIPKENLLLLISDRAPYNVKAFSVLHDIYPHIFIITFLAHLIHNCALHIKAHFVQVDQLISYVKASIVKCKKRAELFHEIGIPPQPIVTRWGTWLEAALYYAKNYTIII
ncbi:hypothetical protein A3Q56_05530 [Intoshia linei]|uniref:DUF659 domain-containing protein n=1 Tax=Intoshia linei TaxID=1819745 RepID=A0A177AY18_9BILA|nr:hypothetical protein A3Q56_05530 [Intoshia linei]